MRVGEGREKRLHRRRRFGVERRRAKLIEIDSGERDRGGRHARRQTPHR